MRLLYQLLLGSISTLDFFPTGSRRGVWEASIEPNRVTWAVLAEALASDGGWAEATTFVGGLKVGEEVQGGTSERISKVCCEEMCDFQNL